MQRREKEMKCPKCGKEMEKGIWVIRSFTQASLMLTDLIWCKEYGFFKAKDKISIMKDKRKESFICKDCKITCAEYK
jgi:uncharacterized Zn finger protein